MPLHIGPYTLNSRLLLSPMAGVTDRPYRDICRSFGAGLTTAEMITSDTSLQHTRKSQLRMIRDDEPEPRSIQIVGTDPDVMANAARFNVDIGAQIIDINMGCPAKKVCNKAAGSALMQDTNLVSRILHAVVNAVDVPVTLKTRTGWSHSNRNIMQIARIAEDAGISCIAIHGRTREQAYTGHAEFESVRQVKQAIDIPVIANGDIHSADMATFIYDYTGVDGLMIARITQGQPWIFSEINHALTKSNNNRNSILTISRKDKINTALAHITAIHRFYGTDQGVRIARKHIGWYLFNLTGHNDDVYKESRQRIFVLSSAKAQYNAFRDILNSVDYDPVNTLSKQRTKAA